MLAAQAASLLVLLTLAAPVGAQVLIAAPLQFPTGTSLDASLAEADWDGDGDLDVLGAGSFGSGTTPRRMLNDGSGHFGAATVISVLGSTKGLCAADLDGDGTQDVVAGSSDGIVRWLGGGGSFASPQAVATAIGFKTFGVADLDLDGALDVVVNNEGSDVAPGRLSVLHNAGDGSLVKLTELGTEGLADRPALADLNSDGLPDVLAAAHVLATDEQWLFVHLNQPGLSFAGPVKIFVGPGETSFLGRPSLLVADLLGGPFPDVAVADYDAGLVRLWRGNGSGALSAAGALIQQGQQSAFSTYPFLRAGDLDGDGHDEVVLFNVNNHRMAWWLSAGGTGFGPPVVQQLSVDTAVRHGVVADLDADGRADLLSIHSGSLLDVPAVDVSFNCSYPAGGPIVGLPGAKAVWMGFVPVLALEGSLAPDSPLVVSVLGVRKDVQHPELQPVVLGVASTSVANLSFKGVHVVPAPSFVSPPMPVDAAGNLEIAATWPAGVPSGSTIYLQFLATGYDTGEHWAATNAVQITAP